MSELLVVGGSRFVGLAIVKAARAAGHRVTLLNRATRPVAGTQQLVADRNDRDAMAGALAGRHFDALIDTSAYTPAQAEILLHALDGRVPRAAVISSAAVYADTAARPPDEQQPTGGGSAWGTYGANKCAVEDVYARGARLSYRALIRPPYIFGPDNTIDRETWFWSRQLNDRVILVPGRGDAPVQFIHSDDLAVAVLTLVTGSRRGLDIFNCADPTVLSLSTLSTLLADVAGCADRQITVGARADGAPALAWFPFGDYPCLARPDRLMHETGWRPAAPLKERFAQTFASHDRARLMAAYQPKDAEKVLVERIVSSA